MTEPSLTVVTCADAKFFHFLPLLEQNIRRKFGHYPVIYDLGMTDQQVRQLKSLVRQIPLPDWYSEVVATTKIRSPHKPRCISDAMEQFGADVLYVDSDVLFTDSLPDGFAQEADIAVTAKHPKEMLFKNPYSNGRINAGVLYFSNNRVVLGFLEKWRELCDTGKISDQLSLSNLLEEHELDGNLGVVEVDGLKVAILDPREFNDVTSSTGRIWHFKNAGRSPHKKRRWWRASLQERWMPNRLKKMTAGARSALQDFGSNRERHKNLHEQK